MKMNAKGLTDLSGLWMRRPLACACFRTVQPFCLCHCSFSWRWYSLLTLVSRLWRCSNTQGLVGHLPSIAWNKWCRGWVHSEWLALWTNTIHLLYLQTLHTLKVLNWGSQKSCKESSIRSLLTPNSRGTTLSPKTELSKQRASIPAASTGLAH